MTALAWLIDISPVIGPGSFPTQNPKSALRIAVVSPVRDIKKELATPVPLALRCVGLRRALDPLHGQLSDACGPLAAALAKRKCVRGVSLARG